MRRTSESEMRGLQKRAAELPFVAEAKRTPLGTEYYRNRGESLLEQLDSAILIWGAGAPAYLADAYFRLALAKKEMGKDFSSETSKLQKIAGGQAVRDFQRRDANFRLASLNATFNETTHARKFLEEAKKHGDVIFDRAYVDVAVALYQNSEKKKAGEVFSQATELAGTRLTIVDGPHNPAPRILDQARIEDLMLVAKGLKQCELDYLPLVEESLEILASDWNPNSKNHSFAIVSDALCAMGEVEKAFELAKTKPFVPDSFAVYHAREWGWKMVEKFLEKGSFAQAILAASQTNDTFLMALACAGTAAGQPEDHAFGRYLDKAQEMADAHVDRDGGYYGDLFVRRTLAYGAIGKAKAALGIDPTGSFEQAREVVLSDKNSEKAHCLTVLGECLDQSGYDGAAFYRLAKTIEQMNLAANENKGLDDSIDMVMSYINLEQICLTEIRQGRLDGASETFQLFGAKQDYMENNFNDYTELMFWLITAHANQAKARLNF